MPYERSFSRSSTGCIIILIDQSSSMGDPFGGDPRFRKCEVAADSINKLLNTLIADCQRHSEIRHYCDVGVIGYGGRDGVGPAFIHPHLKGRDLIPIPEIANNADIEERQRKIPDGNGGLEEVTEQFPFWLKAVAETDTPMCEALQKTKRILNDRILKYMQSFPPIVINITDGEVTDGSIPDMINYGNAIKALSTNDGNVLLFNVHISTSNVQGVLFPKSAREIPQDEYSQALFEMSSPLTDFMIWNAHLLSEKYQSLERGCKCYGYDTNFEQFVHFLQIGVKVRMEHMDTRY